MTDQHTNDAPTQMTATDIEATLRNIGLAPVKAWVPDPVTKASATAKRTKKARDKAAENGLKQLSITIPIDQHALVRAFAARTKAGEPPAQVLDDLRLQMGSASDGSPTIPPATITAVPAGLSAWRRWLISLILPAESRTLLGLRRGGA